MDLAEARMQAAQLLARHVRILTMVTVLVVASFAWENIHLGTASPDDQELISRTVQASQLAQQRLCVPPGPPLNAPETVPSRVVRAMLARVRVEESKHYGGKLLVAKVHLLRQDCSVSARGGSGVIVNGGISSFGCGQVDVIRGSATVSCQAVEWQKSLIRIPAGVQVLSPSGPVNIWDSLVKTSIGWRITAEKLSFPAGSAP
jgi:hypothetical protein